MVYLWDLDPALGALSWARQAANTVYMRLNRNSQAVVLPSMCLCVCVLDPYLQEAAELKQ